jgi:hypothetical protein
VKFLRDEAQRDPAKRTHEIGNALSELCEIEEASHLEVEAEVRYWEDARVNGVEDVDGDLIPGRVGDLWKVRIDLSEGRIEGWPGVIAQIHYKVCDAGEYWLSDREGRRIAKWRGHYVPTSILCPGKTGSDDYIIMTVSASGAIADYQRPAISLEQWAPIR